MSFRTIVAGIGNNIVAVRHILTFGRSGQPQGQTTILFVGAENVLVRSPSVSQTAIDSNFNGQADTRCR